MTVTGHRFYTFMYDPIYRADAVNWSSHYTQSNFTSFYMGSDMTAPTPNAMTWQTEPKPASRTSITMTATTATAYGHGGVEYFFDCVTEGGHDSVWQKSPTYVDTGLQIGKQYSYRVKARGLSHLETAYSTASDASLLVGDFNLDEKVDAGDLEILALRWLNDCNWPQWCVNTDPVDMSYFNALSSNWLLPAD